MRTWGDFASDPLLWYGNPLWLCYNVSLLSLQSHHLCSTGRKIHFKWHMQSANEQSFAKGMTPKLKRHCFVQFWCKMVLDSALCWWRNTSLTTTSVYKQSSSCTAHTRLNMQKKAIGLSYSM